MGVIGGAAYWLAAQFWPSSVAVVLCLFATALIGGFGSADSIAEFRPTWLEVFVLLIKYNALMALTAANLAFSVPENLALGLIMVCGQAASHALLVSLSATRSELSPRAAGGDLFIAAGVGFAPAIVLGIPGLAGLVAAILMRLGVGSFVNRRTSPSSSALLCTVQQLIEACFYLGALATWKYI